MQQPSLKKPAVPLRDDVRRFVESTSWTIAKTYAATWPHEYVVRSPENAAMLTALARHVFQHGTDGRFYSQVRKYHHEGGKVYWSMDRTPEATTLINRCDETQTYEARLAAGTLPSAPTRPSRSSHMSSTVLAHLAASMPQKENLATEALAFILNGSPAARGALQHRLAALVGETKPVARVTTQIAVAEESRPDVVLFAESGDWLGYIEAKFWAGLTAAQPVEYVKRLSDAGGGLLVFLAPERRLPTLHIEVKERLQAAKLDMTDVNPRCVMVGTVRIGLLAWSDLLVALRDAVGADRRAASDVDQLTGLVARFETDGFLPVTRVELDDLDAPRRIMTLADLVNGIMDQAAHDDVLDVKGLKPMHFIYGTGRYAAFPTAGCWLGLDHKLWSTHGRSPIWIRFKSGPWGRSERLRDPLGSWLNMAPPRAYAADGEVLVPILLDVGVEKDRVVQHAVSQLRELKNMLSGLPALGGEAPAQP
jgi:hypothetical protein